MKNQLRLFVVCAVCICLLSICGCGHGGASKQTDEAETTAVPTRAVGMILPDSGTVGGMPSCLLTGLQTAAAETTAVSVSLQLQTGITDASLPTDGRLPEPTTQTTTAAPEPESFTDAQGQVVIKATPVARDLPRTAAYAASRLLADGCSALVFADPMYDDFSAWLAEQYPDIYFLQYEGTHDTLSNLQAFSLDVRAPFYMAGALAAASGETQLGFTAGKVNARNRAWVRAFALGAASENEDAQVVVRFLGVDVDLVGERTASETLLTEDKCTLLAQSVYTALPVSVAAAQDMPCIGFGSDMAADGGSHYLGTVMLYPEVYFRTVLDNIENGALPSEPYVGTIDNGAVDVELSLDATAEIQTALQRSEKEAADPAVFEKEPTNLTVR